MTISRLLAFLLLGALTAGVCEAGVTSEVTFEPGQDVTIIEQSIVRGDHDLYYLTAQAGQKMSVNLTVLEKNVVFAIYKPEAAVNYDKDGTMAIKGASLPGAGEGNDAANWEGALPVSGKYLLVVAGTRGDAIYRLKITLR